MTDIVQRLRLIDPNQVLLAPPPHDTSYLQVGLLCHEAAAEIERLKIERDALLEALKLARPYINPYTLDGYHAEIKADTAIAKSEKELEL